MMTCLQSLNTFWEGIFAVDFTLEQVRQRCEHLGATLQEQGYSCLVAYDSRFMSELFAQDVYQMFHQQGISVQLAPTPAPLPAIHHFVKQGNTDCALVVSARNRPYWYNGLVLIRSHNTAISLSADLNTSKISAHSEAFPLGSNTTQNEISFISPEIREPYLTKIRNSIDIGIIRRSTMTIFVDPMHGTAAGYLPSIIGDESQTMAISINREPDPLFDKLTPLPAVSQLTRLRKLVRESDSHFGLAFSADGTALGVVDKHGVQLDYAELALVLADYLVHQYRQKGRVIIPPTALVKTMSAAKLDAWQKSLGITVDITHNVTEQLATILAQEQRDLIIGCTAEGEIVAGHFSLYPDALLSGLLIGEMIARSGRPLRSLIDDIHSHLATS